MGRGYCWMVSPFARMQPVVRGVRCTERRPALYAKLHVGVLTVGRKTAKEKWAEDAVQELVKRLSPTMEVKADFLKDDQTMLDTLKKTNRGLGYLVGLDATGKVVGSSDDFSGWMYDRLQRGGSRLTFLIGGSDGLPHQVKTRSNQGVTCDEFLSLSSLTFTHKMARLILVEQVYRASEIRKGSKYNK